MAEPVGEDAWISVVDDASSSASDLEQRVAVVELYKRALAAEPCSLRLWLTYCEWVWSLYTDCQNGDAGWPEDEQLLGQELFSLEIALDVWQQGSLATQYRINDSNKFWNRRISIEMELLASDRNNEGVDRVRLLFLDRLQIPHATWEETSQLLSQFLTRFDEPSWEATMIQATKLAKRAKDLYGQREDHELKLQGAIDSGDRELTWNVAKGYLDWEVNQTKKKGPDTWYLCVALHERILSLFMSVDTLWEDYVALVGTHQILAKTNAPRSPTLLAILQRATNHCPWSGPLWARYMLRAEMEDLEFSEIEHIKHSATGSVPQEGIADVFKIYAAWCGYLRRRATAEGATDEEFDVADVGFSSAIESVDDWGKRLYGKQYKGDPAYSLEREYIQYLTAKRSIASAREQWKKLVHLHGDSYEFWQRYYQWELIQWHVAKTQSTASASVGSNLARETLIQALQRKKLDWPEKIMDMYHEHSRNFENAHELAAALNTVHRVASGVAKRRQREAETAAATYAAQQPTPQISDDVETETTLSASTKRKRDVGADTAGEAPSNKKIKDSQEEMQVTEGQRQTRDRENTTVIVTNLPSDTTQTKVRQYFKEYGHINNLTQKVEPDGVSSSAMVEFRTTDDVKSALLRDGKLFGERQIRVESGAGLTLFVTNYPPTADEPYIRMLFEDCGEIFSIRWPSLKYNTHRRFCYISFRTQDGAERATRLDGQILEGKFKLEAKYSEPGKKKSREGPVVEGRELHVANIDKNATEDDLKALFSKYGAVESVRILRNIAGKSKGGGFIVFGKKDDAIEALTLDKTKFMSQVLKVEVSAPSNFKNTATNTGPGGASVSPAPESEAGSSHMSPSPMLETSTLSSSVNTHTMHAPAQREEIAGRTIALMNVPDTVNDARVRALVDQYGGIVKIVLRPDHQGAIVEFATVASAGKASLGLENHEIIPGRRLRTGGVKDLFREKDEYRSDRIQVGAGGRKPAAAAAAAAFLQPAAPVRRPGGGRGGLGTKRGLGYAATKGVTGTASAAVSEDRQSGSSAGTTNGTALVTPKSNADFKAMMETGRK